jgi:hypothetical protein
MGMFDAFDVDDCDGQTKTYDRWMDLIKIGDTVKNTKDLPLNHSIKLRHGKWANVKNNIFVSYTELPETDNLYDKWGREISIDFNYQD